MIRLKCSKCGKVLSLDDGQAGGVVACGCGHRMRVPGSKGPKPTVGAGKSNPGAARTSVSAKSGPVKKDSGKAAVKPGAKPAGAPEKQWQKDDDFKPYTLQPESEPPPPIKINRGGDDEDEEGGRGKKKKKPAKKASSTAFVVRLSILLGILAVGLVLLWLKYGGGGTAE